MNNYASRELEITAVNEEWWIKPTRATLEKWLSRGDEYSKDRAIKYVARQLVQIAKQYCNEYCSIVTRWQDVFPASTRREAAENIADSIRTEYELQKKLTSTHTEGETV